MDDVSPVPANHEHTAIGREEYRQRIAQARRYMQEAALDACVIHAGANLRYFSGVAWGPTERLVAMVLFSDGLPVIVCPEFEVGSLRDAIRIDADLCTWQEHENPAESVAAIIRDKGCGRIGADPLAPWFMVEAMQRALAGIQVGSAAVVTEPCRMRKSAAELALLQQAMEITLQVQQRAFESLRPGITTGQLRTFVDRTHRALGADGGSTFCAIQFGAATAYPHGIAGEQSLRAGDLVLIDTGCQVQGYHSDITRTYVFGDPTDEQRATWQLERDAQQAAFDAVRVGATCESIDHAARSLLVRAGLGPDYRLPGLPHRTGHGIGLAIHEPAYLVPGDRTYLRTGMCFSNEPMIVIPGRFGIRLEDHFHVTEAGAAWFTAPSESITHPFG
ncbi:M24 family metallopeptidase [Lysobacter sp. F60174L2]|uniref:M24 family metallopeptidase n=1 Tax=Lysobacter sp. F60174L2 TaxID=3459295 RepID=UPI00403E300E